MNNPQILDFAVHKIEGPVYTGRDRGEALRKNLNIEQLDASAEPIHVLIPSSTYTVSSSFFLGMFGPSVRKCGSIEKFNAKFHFSAPDSLMPLLAAHASRALQGRKLLG